MNWQHLSYLVPFFISLAITIGIGLYTWRHRAVSGAAAWTVVAFSQALWILGYIFELVSPDLAGKVFWDNVQFFGMFVVPTALLAFALDYTGRKLPRSKEVWAALTVVPILLMLLIFTDDWHHLIRPDARLISGELFAALTYGFTTTIWILSLYSYALTFVGLAILIERFIRPRQFYRGQVGVILLSMLFPILGGLITLAGIEIYFYRDTTPFTFALGNLILVWGLFHYRLFDIVPIARDMVIENMHDGVIVLDAQGRVIDVNPAIQRVIGRPLSQVIGQRASQVFASWTDLVEKYRDVQEAHSEMTIPVGATRYHVEMSLTSLYDRRGALKGRLVVARDITERKQAQEALQRAHDELEHRVQERTLELRTTNEQLQREITERKRAQVALSKSEERFRLLVEKTSDIITILNADGTIRYESPAIERLLGYTSEELVGQSIFDLIHPDDVSAIRGIFEEGVKIQDYTETATFRYKSKDGSYRHFESLARNLIADPTIAGIIINSRDITERKRAEQVSKRYDLLLENARDIILLLRGTDGQVLEANQAAINAYGYDHAELLTKTIYDLRAVETHVIVGVQIRQAIDAGATFETIHRRKDGSTFPVEVNSHGEMIGDEAVLLSIIRDVTERKRVEQEKETQRSEMETLYHLTVELAEMPVAADLEEMVTTRLKQLTGAYIVAVSEYNPAKKQLEQRRIETDSRAIREASRLLGRGVTELAYPVSEAMYTEMVQSKIGYRHTLTEATFGSIPPAASAVLQKLFNLELCIGMAIQHQGDLMGTLMLVLQRGQAVPSEWLVTALANVLSIVYRRKRAEVARLESENRFQALAETLPQSIFECDLEGQLTYANRKAFEVFGYTRLEPGLTVTDLIVESQREQARHRMRRNIEDQTESHNEYLAQRQDNSTFPVAVYSAPIFQSNRAVGLRGVVVDLTELKSAEAALRESEDRYRVVTNMISDYACSVRVETNHELVFEWETRPFSELIGFTPDEIRARGGAHSIIHPDDAPNVPHTDYENPVPTVQEYRIITKGGEVHWHRDYQKPVWDETQGRVVRIYGVTQDITERKRREHELEVIATLSAALRTAPTRAEMLPVILDQVLDLHDVQGETLAIRNLATGEITTELGRGQWANLTGVQLSPDKSVTGRVIVTGQRYVTTDVRHDSLFAHPDLISDLDCAACVPLTVQGQAIGALWVGRRTPIREEEVRLLTSIADIAANAIHRATLHEQTQKHAADLAQAYDTTLEGWAHALELRDQETEGHTRRVAQMTIDLARAMGVGEAEMEDIRRGALLHDIGKMGVPDSVLLKPGTFNEREWEIMKRHPEYAREMLTPIDYLRQALNIPYCHHEKWDGTGYPRGLQGEQIPLAARIFAIADVRDALTSNRPYRAAWSEEDAVKYIREQSGKHFDPRVVEAFLGIVH